MERVVVVGGPGPGKSVLARRLAVVLEAACVELDELWWQQDWRARDRSLARLWSRWPAYGRRIDALVSEHAHHGGVIVRLRFAREVRRWLERVENGLRP